MGEFVEESLESGLHDASLGADLEGITVVLDVNNAVG